MFDPITLDRDTFDRLLAAARRAPDLSRLERRALGDAADAMWRTDLLSATPGPHQMTLPVGMGGAADAAVAADGAAVGGEAGASTDAAAA